MTKTPDVWDIHPQSNVATNLGIGLGAGLRPATCSLQTELRPRTGCFSDSTDLPSVAAMQIIL